MKTLGQLLLSVLVFAALIYTVFRLLRWLTN
jgi:hypothetical protein